MYENEFPQQDELIYLNHAAVAPWPQRSYEAVAGFARENVERGAQGYPDWLLVEDELRHRLRWLINAPSVDDIALLKNTSEGLSVVAYGIDWQAGDNVVFAQQEFPSNRILWETLAAQGVEVRRVDLDSTEEPEDALIQAMDSNTRLLSTSSVHYADGLCMDLDRLSQACREHNSLFCVDAIQSLGVMPFDVQAINADFVMADGHKWMLGPEGLALFYCKAELREQLKLQQYGWHTMTDTSDYSSLEWEINPTAKRFECGSPNMLGAYALNASLSLIQEVGLELIWDQVFSHIELLREQLGALPGISLHSRPERCSGIINFSHREIHPKKLQTRLMQAGVVCAQRGTGVRFSPHFYTPASKLVRAVELVEQFTTAA